MNKSEYRIISPDAVIGEGCSFGDFVKIASNCRIGNRVVLGDYVKLMPGTVIGDDVNLDDYCNTSGYCYIGNGVVVKRQTMIGQATRIEDNVWVGSNVTTNRLKYPVMERKDENEEGVLVQSGCVIGSKALLLAGVTMARGSWLASGGVLTSNTEPGMIYVGSPARKLRPVPPDQRIPGPHGST